MFRKHPLLLPLLGIFTASRVVLYRFFPFHVDFLPWLMQVMDLKLLRDDLLHTLWQLHVTPPLYDLFIGILLKIFPNSMLSFAFSGIYFLFGIVIISCVYYILKFLKTPEWVAFAGGLITAFSPILFRFERNPFYTFPLTMLVILSILFLVKFQQRPGRFYLFLFLAQPIILILFRNFFHIIFYFIPIAVYFLHLVYKNHRHLFRTGLIAAIIFFCIGLIPNIRNTITYGVFSSSTWQGMQLYSLTRYVPKDKIARLADEGRVTPLVFIERFSGPEIYAKYYGLTRSGPDPILDNVQKSSGFANFNHRSLALAGKEYQHNAFEILKRDPWSLGKRFINSVYVFFSFSPYRFFDETDKWLIVPPGIGGLYAIIKLFVLPIGLFLLFVGVVYWLIKNRRKSPILAVLLFQLLYIFFVTNIVELAENNTARVPMDPLWIIATIYMLYQIQSNRRDKKAEAQFQG